MKRGQISLEYLIVVSFVVFAVIIMMGIAIFYTSGARDRIKLNQLSDFANKIIASAESVYFAGEPSKITITAYIPAGVQSFSVVENSLVFTIQTSSGISTVAFSSDVPLGTVTFSQNEGVKRIEVKATSIDVVISEV